MADQTTTLADLKQRVKNFVAEREWQKFHAPKNISMALAVEAAELMEHFQWLSVDESRQPDDQQLDAIAEELCDVVCYAIAMANTLNLDISDRFERKMQKNIAKYPAQEFQGRYKKEQ